MNRLSSARWVWCGSAVVLAGLVLTGCGSGSQESAAGAPASAAATPPAPAAGPGEVLVPVPTAESNRAFLRVSLDKAQFRPADPNNDLGVQVAVLEGDPSKPGFYLVVNRFPPGVMSRPHFHRDERHGLVIKGTWYTGEGEAFTPVPLRAGDYIRHPAGAFHFDGALEEEVVVAISGYGPSSSTVFDGGARFGRVR
jgi:quercetin dioxygenase-like cupin family protein